MGPENKRAYVPVGDDEGFVIHCNSVWVNTTGPSSAISSTVTLGKLTNSIDSCFSHLWDGGVSALQDCRESLRDCW